MAAIFLIKQPTSRLGAVQNPAANTASTAFGSQTYQILVSATTADFIAIGNGPTVSSTTGTALPANVPMFFTVSPGEQIIGTVALKVTELS